MSNNLPMYRHDDETQPAKPMTPPEYNNIFFSDLPDRNELIKSLQWIPITPSEWELDFMQEQARFRRELLEMFRVPPDMMGEITNR